MNSRDSSNNAIRWIAFASVSKAGLQLLQIAVIARLLTPEDFGLMAIVTVILSFASLFSDIGISAAFIQKQNVTKGERSSLYWLNIFSSLVLFFLLVLCSPFLIDFYSEPRIKDLLVLISSNFVVIAFSQQIKAEAEKKLKFKPIAIIEIFSAVIGFIVTIFFAAYGSGVYALVFGVIASVWIATIANWIFLSNGWRPSLRFRWNDVRWYVRFGLGMIVNNIINHINSTADVLLGGRALGSEQLGFYSLPRNLVLQIQFLVNPIFTRVAFPLIASMQNDRHGIKKAYLKIMSLTSAINSPLYIMVVIYANDIVTILFGSQWSQSALMLQALSGFGLLRSFGNPAGSLLFGLGRIRRAALWNTGVLLLILPVIWFSSNYGAVTMSWSLTGLMFLLFFASWLFLIKPACNIGLFEYLGKILLPIILALAWGYASLMFSDKFNTSFSRVIMGGGVFMVCYFISIWFLNKDVRNLFKSSG